jgi:hypothetical protein
MKKEITPVVIHVDELELGRSINLFKHQIIPTLIKIKKEFEVLGLGKINNEYLRDILFGKYRIISQRLAQKIKDEVSSPDLRDAAVTSVVKRLEKLNNALLEFRRADSVTGIPSCGDLCSVDDATGEIVLAEESIQMLREHFSTFAKTERGIKLYEAHQNAAKALSEFISLPEIAQSGSSLNELFVVEDDGPVVPAYFDYDIFVGR